MTVLQHPAKERIESIREWASGEGPEIDGPIIEDLLAEIDSLREQVRHQNTGFDGLKQQNDYLRAEIKHLEEMHLATDKCWSRTILERDRWRERHSKLRAALLRAALEIPAKLILAIPIPRFVPGSDADKLYHVVVELVRECKTAYQSDLLEDRQQ